MALNAKGWFAVERTFLHWASIVMLVALGSQLSILFGVVSVGLLMVAYYTYSTRIALLQRDAVTQSNVTPIFPAVILTMSLSVLLLFQFLVF